MAERTTILLIGGYICALALGAYELQREPSLPAAATGRAPEAPSLPEVPPDTIKNIAAYEAITERPLFVRDRVPKSSTSPKDNTRLRAQSEDIEGMRLAAVLKGPESLTILLEDQAGETTVMHAGDKLGKWQIEEIMDDRVVMISEGRRKTLLVHHFDPAVTRKSKRRQAAASAKRRNTRNSTRALTPRPSVANQRSQKLQGKP